GFCELLVVHVVGKDTKVGSFHITANQKGVISCLPKSPHLTSELHGTVVKLFGLVLDGLLSRHIAHVRVGVGHTVSPSSYGIELAVYGPARGVVEAFPFVQSANPGS